MAVPDESIWTSALATACFLADQRPAARLRIGESGLTTALYEIGYMLTEPTRTTSCSARRARYSFERDHEGHPADRRRRTLHRDQPRPDRPVRRRHRCPATGSVAALITRATGVDPYFVGKPNPLMMRSALKRSTHTRRPQR